MLKAYIVKLQPQYAGSYDTELMWHGIQTFTDNKSTNDCHFSNSCTLTDELASEDPFIQIQEASDEFDFCTHGLRAKFKHEHFDKQLESTFSKPLLTS